MSIFTVWLVLVIYMCLVWCLYRYLKNPAVVDVAWAGALTLSGLIFLFSHPVTLRTVILSIVLILWGSRLGIYLWYTRVRLGLVDKRYLTLSDGWKIAKPLGFFLNFQLQAVLALLISLPWYFTGKAHLSALTLLDYLGILIALVGLVGETLADQQLQNYKKNPNGPVCRAGLWQYSRHPNYFFEWLIWCGFSLFALTSWSGFIGLISPLILYLLMTKITGPMTEEGSIKSRGQAYLDYQKTTPMFFPVGWVVTQH